MAEGALVVEDVVKRAEVEEGRGRGEGGGVR